MCKSDNVNLQDYGQYITSALQTEGGHLSIGRGGFILWFGRGARLSGYDASISRRTASRLARRSSTAGWSPSKISCASLSVDRWRRSVRRRARRPYHALSFAPLCVVAQAYRAAGAEVFNLSDPAGPAPKE